MFKNICVFDTETTGLNSDTCGIIEISLKIVHLAIEKHAIIVDTINPVKTFHMNPGAVLYDAEALKINGYTLDEIKQLAEPEITFASISEYLSGYTDPYSKDKSRRLILCAHNISFDLSFFKRAWEQYKDSYFWAYFQSGHYLDTQILFSEKQIRGLIPDTDKHRVCDMATMLGIPFDAEKAHGSDYDCEVTAQCLKKLLLL